MTKRSPAEYDWSNALFNDRRLPAGGNFTHPRRGTISHVTLHHMTIVELGSGSNTTASLEGCYKTWTGGRQASANYGVSGNQVWQFVSDADAAWSDANSTSNNSTLSIEHTNSTGAPKWEISNETMATGQHLVAALHLLYGLGRPTRKTVRVHQDYYATACPGPYMMAHLDAYIAAAATMYDQMKAGEPVTAPSVVNPPSTDASWSDPSSFVLGATGPDVTRLGERLVIWAKALGLPAPYKSGPGPEFTETDRTAVEAFQKAQGWAGSDADGYPGAQSLTILAADPPPTIDVETISANLAGYDAKKGLKNRVSRAKGIIPAYLAPKKPTWFHFQECAIDMFPELDKHLPEYTRVPAGGKGRESYYRKDAGITIVHAELRNVTHMLLKDTKEFLLTVWEKDGVRGLEVNFHNENEGSTFQSLQLKDVLAVAREVAAKYGVKRANILVTGDSNLKGAALLARTLGWTEGIYSAVKKIDLQYVSTNGWLARLVLGRRIDVDITDPTAQVLEVEQLYGALIADHWPHRILRRLTK